VEQRHCLREGALCRNARRGAESFMEMIDKLAQRGSHGLELMNRSIM